MNNKYNVERLLNPANEALTTSRIVVEGGNVLKEYDGYIAGFGATVINIGIKATLAFYMKDHKKLQDAWIDSSKPSRARVVYAIAKTLGRGTGEELFHAVLHIDDSTLAELSKITREITDASVALKMMIRTHRFGDNGNNN